MALQTSIRDNNAFDSLHEQFLKAFDNWISGNRIKVNANRLDFFYNYLILDHPKGFKLIHISSKEVISIFSIAKYKSIITKVKHKDDKIKDKV